MSVSVSMPQLGESVTEGTVTRWLKKEGERVEADEPLLEVSTDKVDTEIPSPVTGILRGIAVAEDETVAVGAELAVIDEEGAATGGAASPGTPEPAAGSGNGSPVGAAAGPVAPATAPAGPWAPQAAPAAPSWSPPVAPAPAAAAAAAPAPSVAPAAWSAPPVVVPAASAPSQELSPPTQLPTGADGPYVTPLVRKLAAEHTVELSAVTGTGVGGRIRKQDVLEAARARRDAAAAAAAAAAAQQAAAQQAAAAAIPAVPAAAAPVAAPVSAPRRAAIVPSTLRGTTERMSRPRQVIAQRMVESLQVSAQLTTVVEADVTAIGRLRDRAKRDFEAREGVKLSYLPFFALAAIEALKVHPKLNAVIDGDQVTYHDAEHLGIAVDTERGLMVPVIHNAGDLNIGEVIAVRSMVYLALTYDHRLVDGADAARFLITVKNRLEEGAFEAELGL